MKKIYSILIVFGIIGTVAPVLARHPYYTCDTPLVVEATEKQCNLCLNRFWYDGLCYPYEQCSSAEETICPEEFGKCLCVPEGYTWDCGSKDCITCPSSDGKAYCDDTIGTCSCVTVEKCTTEERQTTFVDMIKVALEII